MKNKENLMNYLSKKRNPSPDRIETCLNDNYDSRISKSQSTQEDSIHYKYSPLPWDYWSTVNTSIKSLEKFTNPFKCDPLLSIFTRDMINCASCGVNIQFKIKVLVYPLEEYICLNCLINPKGNQMKKGSSYFIVPETLCWFTPSWTIEEDYLLWHYWTEHKIDNWESVSSAFGEKTPNECETHFTAFYWNSPFNSSDLFLFKQTNDILETNIQIETKLLQEANTKPWKYIPNTCEIPKTWEENNNHHHNHHHWEQSWQYHPKRKEFERRYMEDFEVEIGNLEFNDRDSFDNFDMKLNVLKWYNMILDRRDFIEEWVKKFEMDKNNGYPVDYNNEDKHWQNVMNMLKPYTKIMEREDFVYKIMKWEYGIYLRKRRELLLERKKEMYFNININID